MTETMMDLRTLVEKAPDADLLREMTPDQVRGLRRKGEHWAEHGFRSSWRKACAKAGIAAGLTFHDIRGSAVTRLASRRRPCRRSRR
jgi:integrase